MSAARRRSPAADARSPGASELPPVVLGLNAVILAVTEEVPRVLTVQRAGHALAAPEELAVSAGPATRRAGADLPDALPFGPLDPVAHQTLEKGLRGWVTRQTGLQLGYVEQLYTFGDRFRDPRERDGGSARGLGRLPGAGGGAGAGGRRRRATGGACTATSPGRTGARASRRCSIDGSPRRSPLGRAGGSGRPAARRERIDLAFGLDGAPWDEERVLERYELLYEAGLVREAARDRGEPRRPAAPRPRARASRWLSTTAASWPPRSAACAAS